MHRYKKMLKKLKEEDIPELYRELQGLSEEDKDFFHPHSFDKKTLHGLLDDGENYYIFTDDDENIGFGFLRTFNKYKIPTLGCIIWERHREKGHGYILTKALIRKGKELGYKKIKLKVYSNNYKAILLYEGCGFKKGVRRDR